MAMGSHEDFFSVNGARRVPPSGGSLAFAHGSPAQWHPPLRTGPPPHSRTPGVLGGPIGPAVGAGRGAQQRDAARGAPSTGPYPRGSKRGGGLKEGYYYSDYDDDYDDDDHDMMMITIMMTTVMMIMIIIMIIIIIIIMMMMIMIIMI